MNFLVSDTISGKRLLCKTQQSRRLPRFNFAEVLRCKLRNSPTGNLGRSGIDGNNAARCIVGDDSNRRGFDQHAVVLERIRRTLSRNCVIGLTRLVVEPKCNIFGHFLERPKYLRSEEPGRAYVNLERTDGHAAMP